MAISLLQFAAQTDTPKRQGIIEKVTNESWFLKLFKVIPVDGFSYEYSRRDTLGGIAFRGLNANYTPDIGVVNPQIERLAILGGAVNTDRQIVNKQGDQVRASAIAAKARKIGLQYDKYVLQGDQAANALSFDGLNARLVGNQVIIAGANGANLTAAMLDQAIDQTVGANSDGKIIVCNKYIRRQITALARPLAIGGTLSMPGVVTGQVQTWRDCPIIVMDEDGDEAPILAETETQGASNVTTSVYVIRLGSDSDGEYVQGLIGSAIIDHAAVGLLGTFYQDIIESNIGLGVFHPRAATRLKGLL